MEELLLDVDTNCISQDTWGDMTTIELCTHPLDKCFESDAIIYSSIFHDSISNILIPENILGQLREIVWRWILNRLSVILDEYSYGIISPPLSTNNFTSVREDLDLSSKGDLGVKCFRYFQYMYALTTMHI